MENQPPTTGGRPRFLRRPQIQAEAPPPPQSTRPAPLVRRLPIRQQQPPLPTLSPPIVPQPRLLTSSSPAPPSPQATTRLQVQQEAQPPPISTVRMVEPPVPPPVQPSLRDINPYSPTAPPTPKARQLQPPTPSKPTAEPESKPLMSPQVKSIVVQQESINGGGKTGLSTKRDARDPAKKTAATKEEAEMSIITLAGVNIGAYMELGQHNHSIKQQGGQILHPGQDNKPETEGSSGETATKTKPRASLVNSNVQGMNNSIFFNTTCTAASPGVHVSLSNHRAKPGVRFPLSKEDGYHSNATSATNQGTKPHTANQ